MASLGIKKRRHVITIHIGLTAQVYLTLMECLVLGRAAALKAFFGEIIDVNLTALVYPTGFQTTVSIKHAVARKDTVGETRLAKKILSTALTFRTLSDSKTNQLVFVHLDSDGGTTPATQYQIW
jgi:hypothetical protein